MSNYRDLALKLLGVLMLGAGCSSRDHRLTRMAEQQAKLNQEMVRLNRDVVEGMTTTSKSTRKPRSLSCSSSG